MHGSKRVRYELYAVVEESVVLSTPGQFME